MEEKGKIINGPMLQEKQVHYEKELKMSASAMSGGLHHSAKHTTSGSFNSMVRLVLWTLKPLKQNKSMFRPF